MAEYLIFKDAMKKQRSRAENRPVFRFLVLLAAAAAVQGVYLLCLSAGGDWGLGLGALCAWVLMPMAAALVPFWAALGGVHPLAACLPVGGLPLILYSLMPPLCLACILISLVSAVAAQEWKKRRKKEEQRFHAGKTTGKAAGKKKKTKK